MCISHYNFIVRLHNVQYSLLQEHDAFWIYWCIYTLDWSCCTCKYTYSGFPSVFFEAPFRSSWPLQAFRLCVLNKDTLMFVTFSSHHWYVYLTSKYLRPFSCMRIPPQPLSPLFLSKQTKLWSSNHTRIKMISTFVVNSWRVELEFHQNLSNIFFDC